MGSMRRIWKANDRGRVEMRKSWVMDGGEIEVRLRSTS
jgi:hypothetical protein